MSHRKQGAINQTAMTQMKSQVKLHCLKHGKSMLHQMPLAPGQVFGAQVQENLSDHIPLSEMRAKNLTQQISLMSLSELAHYSHAGRPQNVKKVNAVATWRTEGARLVLLWHSVTQRQFGFGPN